MKQRENFGSRLGFILISAGCAIGLGNVWRFPYIVGQYGGAAFILVYLFFLVFFGLPIMTMEFSVGRASGLSIGASFKSLEPKGTKWHLFGGVGMAGNYLLVMFYTVVSGWMLAYIFKMLRGDFVGLDQTGVEAEFTNMVASPAVLVTFMVIIVVLGFGICSLGLKNGVEKITKVMMVALLAVIVLLAIRSVTMDGAGAGLKYYLVPNFKNFVYNDEGKVIVGEAVFAAMGQAFFTLSIGMGSMAIFGSYIKRDRRLMGESVTIAALDTFVALVAGLIIIPACFASGVSLKEPGPGLIFKALPNVFREMPGGSRVWGTLFFVFMFFAAMSTIVAVFENIISFGMDLKGWSRRKSCLINLVAVTVLSLPCALGFNVLSGFTPFGGTSNVLDLEDFIISNNILPLGSAAYVLFCTSKKGWGYDGFIKEANTGAGIPFPRFMKGYAKYVLPVLLIGFWAWGILAFFEVI
ncbi:MAG: sodium-dependent transporter [Clostridia bacterium]|nr:sodium-dependent transporter [Clostridia bacterium]